MERYVTNEGDIELRHRFGCQILFFILAILMLAVACVGFFVVKGVKWTTYFYLGVFGVIGIFVLFVQSRRLIKERINKIPYMTITDKSLILSRKKDEYNEIPFDVIQDFRLYRRTHGTGRDKSTTTYLQIIYKAQDESAPAEKFERVTDIVLNGLNMMHNKLEKQVKERLQLYKEKNSLQ